MRWLLLNIEDGHGDVSLDRETEIEVESGDPTLFGVQ